MRIVLFSLALIAFAGIGTAAPKMPPTRPAIQGTVPHGAQRGTEVAVSIRGANLQNASRIEFATKGIQAVILEGDAYRLKARIQVGPQVELGRHDFRLIAPHGSVTGWFDVSGRAELSEAEPNDSRQKAQSLQLPALVNGTVRAGDYDYFRFQASAGQVFTFDINATRNGSPLDSVLSLLDSAGREVAYSDDYYGFKDPHLVYRFPADGVYFLRIYGSGESGSDNSDYRLIAGDMPQVDFAMPQGATRGATVEVTLNGLNLQQLKEVILGDGLSAGEVLQKSFNVARIRFRLPENAAPGTYRLHADGAALPIPFVLSELPELTVPADGARSRKDPIPVTLPVVANGVIDKPRGGNYFAFTVDQPQSVVLSAESMQLGFLLDPLVAVYDEGGQRIAHQDEPTTNTGKEPANLDPHLVVKLPKAGRYTVMIRDSQFRGNPTWAYRLTMKRAEPSFTLTAVGMDQTLFRGRENTLLVRVRRLEGWDQPVELWAENLPAGVTASKIVVKPENTPYTGTCGETHYLDGTNVEFPIQVAPDAARAVHPIRFRARGVMDGKAIERMSWTRYWDRRIKVTGKPQTGQLWATVTDAPKLVLSGPEKLAVAVGKSGKATVIVTRLDGGETPLEIGLLAPVPGLSVEPMTIPAGVTRAEVPIQSSSAVPVRLTLAGRSGGQLLGQSHPITIDPAAKPAPIVESDDN